MESGAADQDVIHDLVHQFSDPFAFYRELIQNSIDAGSTRIEVTLRYQPGPGRGLLVARVDDWGEGMSRRLIEDYLVTKFRSSKEGDLTKIGKFGIGFLSVFACAPDLVVVETGRDGEDWRVLFFPDHTWELLRCPEPREGTSVVLHKAMDASAYEEFAARSLEAVSRWCRHSEVEVGFAAGDASGSAPGAVRAVREPLRADAPFQVEWRDAHTRVVAGPAGSEPPLCGFYNRGLTLLEVREPLVPGVSFKVVSDLLEHTLTRDDVRRDQAFERVMGHVRKLAAGPLRERAVHELREAAAAAPRLSDYAWLLQYCRRPEVGIPAAELCFPTAGGPPASARALREAAERAGALPWAPGPDSLAVALAAAGLAVVYAPKGPAEPFLAAALEAAGATRAAPAGDLFTLVHFREAAPDLPGAVAGLLRAAGVQLARVGLGRVEGVGAERPYALTGPEGGVGTARETSGTPLPAHRGGLCLNEAHPRVAALLRLAQVRPRLAAVLLARLVAVRGGVLGEDADWRLTQAALGPP